MKISFLVVAGQVGLFSVGGTPAIAQQRTALSLDSPPEMLEAAARNVLEAGPSDERGAITPLMAAAYLRDPRFEEMLAETHVVTPDLRGWNALMWAVLNPDGDPHRMVEAMLSKVSRVDYATINGQAFAQSLPRIALEAAERGHCESVLAIAAWDLAGPGRQRRSRSNAAAQQSLSWLVNLESCDCLDRVLAECATSLNVIEVSTMTHAAMQRAELGESGCLEQIRRHSSAFERTPDNGSQMLLVRAAVGDAETLGNLLDEGVEFDGSSIHITYPLHGRPIDLALAGGHAECVALILELGRVEGPPRGRRWPELAQAAKQDDPDAFRLFVEHLGEHERDYDEADRQLMLDLALVASIETLDRELIQTVIAAGGQASMTWVPGSALRWIPSNGDPELLRLVLSTIDPSKCDEATARDAFFFAAESPRPLHMLETLVELGVPLTARIGAPALRESVEDGQEDVALWLLEHGAGIEPGRNAFSGVYMHAVRHSMKQFVTSAVARGGEALQLEGPTALTMALAIEPAQLEIADILLDAGVGFRGLEDAPRVDPASIEDPALRERWERAFSQPAPPN